MMMMMMMMMMPLLRRLVRGGERERIALRVEAVFLDPVSVSVHGSDRPQVTLGEAVGTLIDDPAVVAVGGKGLRLSHGNSPSKGSAPCGTGEIV